MRRVPVSKVQNGVKVGKTLFNEDGKVLLREGTVLNESKAGRLEDLGYDSLYIKDGLSPDTIEDMVSPEVRIKSVKEVRKVFQNFDTYIQRLNQPSATNLKAAKRMEYQSISDITSISTGIVEELLLKKNNVINMVDIKNKNGYLYQHSVNVAVLSVIFGMKLGLDHSKLKALAMGSLMHDIGYNFLEYERLEHEGPLTDEEILIKEEHPLKGYVYLRDNIDVSAHVRMIVYQHHEWMNGEGYPMQLKGDEITELARIVAITDMYDALTSDRPYRLALEPQTAIEYLLASSLHQLDPELVKKFVKIIIPYPIGTVVKLSNGEVGVVEELDLEYPLRPIIKVVKQVSRKVKLFTRDLTKENNILIESVEYEIPDTYLM